VAQSSRKTGVRPDSCEGDSGGPTWVRTRQGATALAAIASRAVKGREYCGAGGIYSLVTPAIIDEIRLSETAAIEDPGDSECSIVPQPFRLDFRLLRPRRAPIA
jgi:hypothetical protein